MEKSDAAELLAQLYLRLNGFFTTGLILHSPKPGTVATELDCLAIRHPHHSQRERRVPLAEFLGNGDGFTEIIICEVKRNPEHVRFNDAIKSKPEALEPLLHWIGLFIDDDVPKVASQLLDLFQDSASTDLAQKGVVVNGVRIRPMLCCPSTSDAFGDRWVLTGREIFAYTDICFHPDEARDTCSTNYGYAQWGFPFTRIVQFLKDGPRRECDINELYKHLNAA